MASNADLKRQAEHNISFAERLLERCRRISSVDGVGLLQRKITADLDFFLDLAASNETFRPAQARQIECSNLRFYNAVLDYVDNVLQRQASVEAEKSVENGTHHPSVIGGDGSSSSLEDKLSSISLLPTPSACGGIPSAENGNKASCGQPVSRSGQENGHKSSASCRVERPGKFAAATPTKPVTGLFRTVKWSGGSMRVDVVLDLGFTWVKVVARNPIGLHRVWLGLCNPGEKSVVDQAETYLAAAAENCGPTVVFHFAAGVTQPVRQELLRLGVSVSGEVVPVPDELRAYDDSDQSDQDSEETKDTDLAKIASVEVPSADQRAINMDVPALFALVSSLTNGHAHYIFKEPLLDHQAAMERAQPALPFVESVIRGRRLICCQTAVDNFKSIVEVVGGPTEKERAEELLPRLEVVPDAVSPAAAGLKLTGKVKERSRIIFGSGDNYNAITLTANKGFVQAATNQGIKFAVILHGSRALSEQKQMIADPL